MRTASVKSAATFWNVIAEATNLSEKKKDP